MFQTKYVTAIYLPAQPLLIFFCQKATKIIKRITTRPLPPPSHSYPIPSWYSAILGKYEKLTPPRYCKTILEVLRNKFFVFNMKWTKWG